MLQWTATIDLWHTSHTPKSLSVHHLVGTSMPGAWSIMEKNKGRYKMKLPETKYYGEQWWLVKQSLMGVRIGCYIWYSKGDCMSEQHAQYFPCCSKCTSGATQTPLYGAAAWWMITEPLHSAAAWWMITEQLPIYYESFTTICNHFLIMLLTNKVINTDDQKKIPCQLSTQTTHQRPTYQLHTLWSENDTLFYHMSAQWHTIVMYRGVMIDFFT